jgi:hypothetical protein
MNRKLFFALFILCFFIVACRQKTPEKRSAATSHSATMIYPTPPDTGIVAPVFLVDSFVKAVTLTRAVVAKHLYGIEANQITEDPWTEAPLSEDRSAAFIRNYNDGNATMNGTKLRVRIHADTLVGDTHYFLTTVDDNCAGLFHFCFNRAQIHFYQRTSPGVWKHTSSDLSDADDADFYNSEARFVMLGKRQVGLCSQVPYFGTGGFVYSFFYVYGIRGGEPRGLLSMGDDNPYGLDNDGAAENEEARYSYTSNFRIVPSDKEYQDLEVLTTGTDSGGMATPLTGTRIYSYNGTHYVLSGHRDHFFGH